MDGVTVFTARYSGGCRTFRGLPRPRTPRPGTHRVLCGNGPASNTGGGRTTRPLRATVTTGVVVVSGAVISDAIIAGVVVTGGTGIAPAVAVAVGTGVTFAYV